MSEKKGFWASLFGGGSGGCCNMQITEEPAKKGGLLRDGNHPGGQRGKGKDRQGCFYAEVIGQKCPEYMEKPS